MRRQIARFREVLYLYIDFGVLVFVATDIDLPDAEGTSSVRTRWNFSASKAGPKLKARSNTPNCRFILV